VVQGLSFGEVCRLELQATLVGLSFFFDNAGLSSRRARRQRGVDTGS